MLIKGVIYSANFFLQNIENRLRLCRLACVAAGEGVVGVNKAGGLFCVVGNIANGTPGTVKATPETVNLAIYNY